MAKFHTFKNATDVYYGQPVTINMDTVVSISVAIDEGFKTNIWTTKNHFLVQEKYVDVAKLFDTTFDETKFDCVNQNNVKS
tara:strand:- start:322 stop:564 length:243 start_codon:yes stop_codon:yes gene_type:complete